MDQSKRRRIVCVLFCCLVAGCQTTPVRTLNHGADTAELTESEQRRWYAANDLDDRWRNKGLLYRDAELTAYVQSLANRLYPEFDGVVQVRIADSTDLNAFALPNGSIYLNLGLIARVRNEAQLATILAHEVSHFKFQHGLKQRNAADTAAVAGLTITLLTGIPFTGQLVALSAMSGYSQEAEVEADREGFRRMVAHGYDGAEAAAVFEILRTEAEALDIERPWLYASHPRLTDRIATMQALESERAEHGGTVDTPEFARLTQALRPRLLARYLEAHKYKQLILVLENSALRAAYPEYADFFLGEAYRQRNDDGDRQKARAAYMTALNRAPDYAPTYRALGVLEMHAGHRREALAYLNKYLSLAPNAGDRAYIESYRQRLETGP